MCLAFPVQSSSYRLLWSYHCNFFASDHLGSVIAAFSNQQILENDPYGLHIALLQATTKFVSVQSSSKVIYEGDPSWLVSEIFSHDRSLSAWGHVIYSGSQTNVGSV